MSTQPKGSGRIVLSVVEGVLVSEGEGDDGESGDSVGWDSCVDEDSAEEESVDEDWLDRASVDEGGGGFSGVGVDGEGWIIADVTVLDIVDVSQILQVLLQYLVKNGEDWHWFGSLTYDKQSSRISSHAQ